MAISAEHLPDDATAIPGLVQRIRPGYRVEASDCLDFVTRVRPAVLFFRP